MANNLRCETIKVGEIDIHYLTGGQGKPLVFIHGGGSGSATWLQAAMNLSERYHVYVPDLPGFGQSKSMTNNFHLSEFVAFVEDFSHSLGLKRFHLVGHSVGGCIALLYALKFPQKTRKLVLVSSMCLGKEIALWVRFLSGAAFRRSLGEIAFAIFKSIKWLVIRFRVPLRFINPLSRIKIDIGRSITTLKGQTTLLVNQLPELVMPTLLVWGANDSIIPASHAYAAAGLIPDREIHVLQGCGHNVHKKKATEFSEILARFLD